MFVYLSESLLLLPKQLSRDALKYELGFEKTENQLYTYIKRIVWNSIGTLREMLNNTIPGHHLTSVRRTALKANTARRMFHRMRPARSASAPWRLAAIDDEPSWNCGKSDLSPW
jgi:hypothetical protein